MWVSSCVRVCLAECVCVCVRVCLVACERASLAHAAVICGRHARPLSARLRPQICVFNWGYRRADQDGKNVRQVNRHRSSVRMRTRMHRDAGAARFGTVTRREAPHDEAGDFGDDVPLPASAACPSLARGGKDRAEMLPGAGACPHHTGRTHLFLHGLSDSPLSAARTSRTSTTFAGRCIFATSRASCSMRSRRRSLGTMAPRSSGTISCNTSQRVNRAP